MARDGAFLLVSVTGRPTVEVELGSEPVVIGREEGCAVPIDRPYVSRRHAEIRPRGKGYELVDLGARNPITVNGLALQDRRSLVSGALVRLGPDAYVEFWDHRKDVATTALLDDTGPRSSAADARARRETRRPAPTRGTPRALLVTTLHNARRIGAVEAAASHVFGVHRGILEEELKRADADGRVVDDGCTADLADPVTAVLCALAILERAARYNSEHPSLPLLVSVAIAGAGAATTPDLADPAASAAPLLPTELLLTATALLRRSLPLELLVNEAVASAVAANPAVETRERGLFALGAETPRPLFAVAPRALDSPREEERTLRIERST